MSEIKVDDVTDDESATLKQRMFEELCKAANVKDREASIVQVPKPDYASKINSLEMEVAQLKIKILEAKNNHNLGKSFEDSVEEYLKQKKFDMKCVSKPGKRGDFRISVPVHHSTSERPVDCRIDAKNRQSSAYNASVKQMTDVFNETNADVGVVVQSNPTSSLYIHSNKIIFSDKDNAIMGILAAVTGGATKTNEELEAQRIASLQPVLRALHIFMQHVAERRLETCIKQNDYSNITSTLRKSIQSMGKWSSDARANAEFTKYALAAANGKYMYWVNKNKNMTDLFENEEGVVKKGKSKQGAKAQKLA
jgi:hypothetical protein